ncbi:MAG: hypothetical protein ACE5H9_12870 [Anaerolineae bacterium]
MTSPSPFAHPMPNVRIREGAPPIVRPTKEEIVAFPAGAKTLLEGNWRAQEPLVASGNYNLSWLEGRHVLLAGATGPGLGGGLASAVLNLMDELNVGSLTIIARDLSRSLNYETGRAMQAQAEEAGLGPRFQWLNDGTALEGKAFEKSIAALKEAGARRLVYVNTVAAAISGVLPGMPTVYVKDVDDEGLLQWQLKVLTEQEINITRTVMGSMAVEFPRRLEAAGFPVEASVFADWRGSLDKAGRDPSNEEYGRQGAYSTSLYLPKLEIQEAARQAYGSGKVVLDIFYPIMRTRALPFIPGGMTMARVFGKLMEREGIRRIEVPELALMTLDRIGKALTEGYDNPFPRLDAHEMPLDEWFYEVVLRLNDDESSDFYYRRWLDA